jgi:uncharacterized membrane protein YdjX (TVP38/TMEM64 family)
VSKNLIKKLVILVVLAAVVAAFMVFDLGQYLTLSYIKDSQERFQAYYAENRALVISGFMAVYILVTALSLPGAAVMTLAAGALFGLVVGTVMVSFASTIGATLACLVARFLLRDWIQRKFGKKLEAINAGVEREGAFYLFTLRLIPIFPFWLINLTMGLMKMPLRTFYWVSQVGMFPGTIVYVNAGKQIGKIDSLSGILSLELIISFAILGLFPITAKKLIAWYRRGKGRETIDSGSGGEKDG